MKKIYTALFLIMIIASCKKQDKDQVQPNQSTPTSSQKTTTSIYYPFEITLNQNTIVSSSAATCNSSFSGGLVFKMTYFNKSTGDITFQISLNSGAAFGSNGTAYIRQGDACGTSLIPISVGASDVYANLSVKCQFSYPYFATYVATVELSTGTKYYTNPIVIMGQPLTWGDTIGFFGVPIFSNGYGGYPGNKYGQVTTIYGEDYQCSEYVARYYEVVNNMKIGTLNAIDYWNDASSIGLRSYSNGGSVAPQAGDIIVFDNGGDGHVGIVGTGAGSDSIRIYEENVGYNPTCKAYADVYITSGNIVDHTYLGTGWTTKGWLRP